MVDVSVPFGYAAVISQGPATMRISAIGNNPAITVAAAPEDIWAGAALGVLNGIDHKNIQKPASPVSMEIISSNVNDTVAGTGARTVSVTYLDANYNQVTSVLNMNGTTAVPLPTTAIRINNVTVATSGTVGGTNLGNISVRLVGGLGATFAYMSIGSGIALSSLYTVPANLAFDLLTIFTSINGTTAGVKDAFLSLVTQTPGGRVARGLQFSASSTVPVQIGTGNIPILSLPEKTDIWIRVEAVDATIPNLVAALQGIQRNQSNFSL